LLTLKAARLLERAEIVFYDALVHPDTVALAARAAKVAVGKRCHRHSTAQRFINKQLVDAARTHDVVVRLKGGDPMLFGRAQEEIDALEGAGVAFEVVPGITAALAASAQLGVSLTRRGISRNVAFVTARVGEAQSASDWAASALAADTAAIYMGACQAQAIAATLIARGRSAGTPVALVESASLPQSQVRYGTLATLPHLAAAAGSGPAVILLGDVLRERLSAQRDAAGHAESQAAAA
jgi:uroporphyrin-III C-methyltransferase